MRPAALGPAGKGPLAASLTEPITRKSTRRTRNTRKLCYGVMLSHVIYSELIVTKF